MSTLGGLGAALGPVADVAKKTAKAQKVKSLKVKVKFGDKKQEQKPDGEK